uniref:Uncharacterized protein n=1 Tax=Candidatus Kentrum sp. DK TaxID=2126562 RepID=A0A450SDK1_9GAMM|nr:MAG: hypothetical protein BECKDK2373C_GA0170839_102925 [Candidatus Kentron sp. DK]VFJ54555.1 MAG: hypothetical protein BECKDK2373B_GA0170837_104713 [Candidatus Kentron sp. DK]
MDELFLRESIIFFMVLVSVAGFGVVIREILGHE